MPRVPRKRSESDFYHIVIRGVGKQIIFEDEADRRSFAELLNYECESRSIEILAWCLMSNHVHMLMHAPIELISKLMLAIESRYATLFNARHDRVGTLFQGRFTSVPIESDAQLLETIRYIHFNPVNAGEQIDTWWSSYLDYFGMRSDRPIDTSCSLALDMLDGIEGFASFHTIEDVPAQPKSLPRHRLTEDQAVAIAHEVLGEINPYDVRTLDKKTRNALIVRMRKAGLSARQISRITSIGLNIIYRAE